MSRGASFRHEVKKDRIVVITRVDGGVGALFIEQLLRQRRSGPMSHLRAGAAAKTLIMDTKVTDRHGRDGPISFVATV